MTSRLLGAPRSACVRREDGPAHADDAAVLDDQLVDAVAVQDGDASGGDAGLHPARRTARRTPGPVPHVMWNRGTELPWPPAVPAAALGPPDDGEEPDALLVQPRPLLAGGELQVGLGPAAAASGPRRGRTRRTAEPVLSRASARESCTPIRRCSGESMRNSPPNDHQAWPPNDAAGSCSTIVTRLARIQEFGGGDQAGEAGSDDDGVGLRGGHPCLLRHAGWRRSGYSSNVLTIANAARSR